jgi:hypothetical protein
VIGGSLSAGLGGVAGLVVGLIVYPPTAWFAVFEVAVPSIFLGYILGFLVGSAAYLFRLAVRRSS